MKLEYSTIRLKTKQYFTQLMVQLGFIERAPINISHINNLINEQLPVNFKIDIPGGSGELCIQEIDSQLIGYSDSLQIVLLCDFINTVKQTVIYKTHLKLRIEAIPNYDLNEKVIELIKIKIISLDLISDQYSLLNDCSTLINRLLPSPVKSIFNSTLAATMAILDSTPVIGKSLNEVASYLSLYSNGSKQMILDYHRDEIEAEIIKFMDEESMKYKLDQHIFEEKLFTKFGKKIIIDDGDLFFLFKE